MRGASPDWTPPSPSNLTRCETPDHEAQRLPEPLRRNEAAVDSELALLPDYWRSYLLAGPMRNPVYAVTNAAQIQAGENVPRRYEPGEQSDEDDHHDGRERRRQGDSEGRERLPHEGHPDQDVHGVPEAGKDTPRPDVIGRLELLLFNFPLLPLLIFS